MLVCVQSICLMTCNILQTLVKLLNCLLKFFDQVTNSLDTPQHLIIQHQFGNVQLVPGECVLCLALTDRV